MERARLEEVAKKVDTDLAAMRGRTAQLEGQLRAKCREAERLQVLLEQSRSSVQDANVQVGEGRGGRRAQHKSCAARQFLTSLYVVKTLVPPHPSACPSPGSLALTQQPAHPCPSPGSLAPTHLPAHPCPSPDSQTPPHPPPLPLDTPGQQDRRGCTSP